MKKLCFLLLITCLLAGSVSALEVLKSADVSCRTDINNPTTNRHDSSKLSIRSDGSAAKSWIKFDLSTLSEPNDIRGAVLRLALNENEGNYYFTVSAVNDDCLDNIDWAEREITWNNAPANDISSQYDPDLSKATLMGTVDISGNYTAGSQHFVDVSSAVLGDTDGIVQFILHRSNSLINCSTHDHGGGESYWPTLILTYPPLGADWPNPADNADDVKTSLTELSWTNPDPNDGVSAIVPTVYLGTEPNRLGDMDAITLGADAESVAINLTNFPNYGDLDDKTSYYWFVDCDDSGNLIPGEEWSFETYDNDPPVVDAGADQVNWLTNEPNTVTLTASASDDGLAGPLTYVWEETAGPGTSVIASPDQLSTVVSFVEAGDYTFTFTADDGELQTSDTVRVVIGNGSCDATHVFYDTPYNDADANQDCLVDLADFVSLIADDWLNCTDVLTGCAI